MNLVSKWIADFVLTVGHQTQAFWENLTLLNFSLSQVVIDVLLVSIVFYYLFLVLKGSRAVNVLIGIIIVAFVFIISKMFQLVTLGWLLDRFFTIMLVAIPVLFQQELRMALEKIGHTNFSFSQKLKEMNLMVSSIVQASEYLANHNIGALIVFQNTVPLKEYVDTGVALNSKISKELLVTIFQTKSPLHDGAVIIVDDQISAAGCLLPHSYKSYGQTLGTRHKAALGLAENTDAKIIVISEEQGTISYAEYGHFERNITSARLQVLLTDFLKPKNKNHPKRHPKASQP